MKTTKEYQILGMLGEKLGEQGLEMLEGVMALRKLAKKYQRLAEADCNGYGIVNGTIDDYAKREHGYGVQSAYVSDDVTIFTIEMEKLETKIKRICSDNGLRVAFQGDPRGYCVKVQTLTTADITEIIHA